MGCVGQQPLPLVEGLVDQAVVALLEIAQAAVDQLGRLRRGPRREVLGLDQGGPQPPGGGVEGHAASGDAAPDDQHVEVLRGQAEHRLLALEGDGRVNTRPQAIDGM